MRKKQSGAILVISLIILFSLTLFVLSGSQSVLVQEKMTAAVRNMHVSLEIAESGITEAETYIETLAETDISDDFTSDGTGDPSGLYSKTNCPSDLFADSNWTNANTMQATKDVSGEKEKYALYFIVDMGEITFEDSSLSISSYGDTSENSPVEIFKIVSRSLGSNGNSERVIVSYYAKTFES